MITFKTFLDEARMAPLYHATYFHNIPDILKVGLYDKNESGTVHFMGMKTASRQYRSVSTARSLLSAQKYIDMAGFRWKHSAVIVLDQDKLARDYRIIPHDYFGSQDIRDKDNTNKHNYRSEAEEAIILRNNKPIPIKKYAIKILLPKPYDGIVVSTEEFKQVEKAVTEAGIPWEYHK